MKKYCDVMLTQMKLVERENASQLWQMMTLLDVVMYAVEYFRSESNIRTKF